MTPEFGGIHLGTPLNDAQAALPKLYAGLTAIAHRHYFSGEPILKCEQT